jgi:hypothetical protein
MQADVCKCWALHQVLAIRLVHWGLNGVQTPLLAAGHIQLTQPQSVQPQTPPGGSIAAHIKHAAAAVQCAQKAFEQHTHTSKPQEFHTHNTCKQAVATTQARMWNLVIAGV